MLWRAGLGGPGDAGATRRTVRARSPGAVDLAHGGAGQCLEEDHVAGVLVGGEPVVEEPGNLLAGQGAAGGEHDARAAMTLRVLIRLVH